VGNWIEKIHKTRFGAMVDILACFGVYNIFGAKIFFGKYAKLFVSSNPLVGGIIITYLVLTILVFPGCTLYLLRLHLYFLKERLSELSEGAALTLDYRVEEIRNSVRRRDIIMIVGIFICFYIVQFLASSLIVKYVR